MTDGKMEGNPCADGDSDCQKAASLVDFYIDNLLEKNDQQFINQHMNDCPDCKDGFDFELSFHNRVKKLTPLPMPDIVKSNIMLALGFPGMSAPMKGSFSALGFPDNGSGTQVSSDFGIPKGKIPKGQIPASQESFEDEDPSSR